MVQQKVMGLAWFNGQSDYDAVRAVAGIEDMPSTYAEWVVSAERLEQEQEECGVKVIRAAIEPGHFFSFCVREGLDVGSKARVRFASHFVFQVFKGGK